MDSKTDEKTIKIEAEKYLDAELVSDGKLTPYGETRYEQYLEDCKEWFYDEEQGKWIHV